MRPLRAPRVAPAAISATAAATARRPAGAAPVVGAPAVSEAPLDRLLRFTGGAASSALEAAFAAASARTLSASRTVYLLFFAVAWAAVAAVGAETTAGGATALDWAHVAASCVCLALVPAARASRPWVTRIASWIAVEANFLAIDPGVTALATASGRYDSLMLYCAMPLVAGVVFVPGWRVYGVLCLVHAIRAVGVLPAVGAVPPLLVCIACIAAVLVAYLQELRSREHFVRCCAAFPCVLCVCVCVHVCLGIDFRRVFVNVHADLRGRARVFGPPGLIPCGTDPLIDSADPLHAARREGARDVR